MNEPTYTKEEIKAAIYAELTASGYLGEGKSRYYEIVGIVTEALKRRDISKNIKDAFKA